MSYDAARFSAGSKAIRDLMSSPLEHVVPMAAKDKRVMAESRHYKHRPRLYRSRYDVAAAWFSLR